MVLFQVCEYNKAPWKYRETTKTYIDMLLDYNEKSKSNFKKNHQGKTGDQLIE